MLANMASSLILHKRIHTTHAKAKALRVYVEPLITKSKEDTTHSRRTVFSYLKQKEAVTELFRVIAPKVADRPGGYTRILKTGFRQGDAADMAIIELVDFNEVALASATPKDAKKASTRRGRAKKATDTTAKATEAAAELATENVEVVEEAPKAKKSAAPKKKVEKVEEEVAPAETVEVVEEAPVAEEPAAEETAPVEEAKEEEKAE